MRKYVMSTMMNTKTKTGTLTTCALMAAIMCILCPMSLPIGPIPISLQIFVCLLATYILGTTRALISFMVYLFLGAVGLPVFSGFQGGLAKLAGPTGGYIIGFIFTILIAGSIIDRFGRQGELRPTKADNIPQFSSKDIRAEKMKIRRIIAAVIGMTLGIAAAYLFGTIWFIHQAQCDLSYALSVCVIPFIPLDLMKMAAAIVLGTAIRKALRRSDILIDK